MTIPGKGVILVNEVMLKLDEALSSWKKTLSWSLGRSKSVRDSDSEIFCQGLVTGKAYILVEE